jgi:hypothetical protein
MSVTMEKTLKHSRQKRYLLARTALSQFVTGIEIKALWTAQ